MLQGHGEDLRQEILAFIREAQDSGGKGKASLAEIQEKLISRYGLSIKPALYDMVREMGRKGQIIRESAHPSDVALSLP